MPEQTTDHEKILEERIRSETTELVKQFNERINPELVEREMSNAVSGLRSASVKTSSPCLPADARGLVSRPWQAAWRAATARRRPRLPSGERLLPVSDARLG